VSSPTAEAIIIVGATGGNRPFHRPVSIDHPTIPPPICGFLEQGWRGSIEIEQ